MDEHIAVLGAGSWGTALANLLAGKGLPTVLWCYEPEVADGIGARHRNPVYLKGAELDARLRATPDLADSLEGATMVLSVSPSHVTRGVLTAAAAHVGPETLVVSASKGIEVETLDTMAEVIAETLPDVPADNTAYLSGPSFAMEVANEHPTAVAIASTSAETAVRAQHIFQTDFFRVYTNSDVRGVELAGALKNVMAIAAGVVDGLEFGHNTLAALITRGAVEMTRLGVALGARPETFAGLAGMGDLILTCTGGLSRNRSVGVELGRGRTLDEILDSMSEVAEGVRTTRSAIALARRAAVEMPIVEEVHAILFEAKDPREAVTDLMTRDPKEEGWGG